MEITQFIATERDRGLLGGDYANYHAQAARKIHALRRRLGSATPRGRKYSPKSPVTATNISQDIRWLHLLLASSERAWADAMTMKTLQSPENTQKPMVGSTKKQIVSRYRRAIVYAINLVEILSDTTSKASNTDLLEAKAYLEMLRGGLHFEKSRWTPCLSHYAIARLVYAALDSNSKTDIYKDLLSNTVDPSIKYAAYQLKLPRTKAVIDIAVENFPVSETSTRTQVQEVDALAFKTSAEKIALAQSGMASTLPTSITWRSKRVPIDEAAVSQALGVSQDREILLSEAFKVFQNEEGSLKALAASYEEVIDSKQEVVDIIKATIDELRQQGIDQGDTRIQSLQIARTAANYSLIEYRVGRNRILLGSDDGLTFELQSQKHSTKEKKQEKDEKLRTRREEGTGRKLARLRESVALIDSILQSLDAIKDLPGVVADTQLMEETDARTGYFRALKYLAIGRSHASNGNTANALALFSHANDLAQQNLHQSSTVSLETHPTKLEITKQQWTAMRDHLGSLTIQYRALADLKRWQASQVSKESSHVPPLLEKFYLRQYDASVSLNNLVNYPPKLQPIPVKPLFFDLAWNYIQYPGRLPVEPEPVVEQVPETKPAKKGWFGFGR